MWLAQNFPRSSKLSRTGNAPANVCGGFVHNKRVHEHSTIPVEKYPSIVDTYYRKGKCLRGLQSTKSRSLRLFVSLGAATCNSLSIHPRGCGSRGAQSYNSVQTTRFIINGLREAMRYFWYTTPRRPVTVPGMSGQTRRVLGDIMSPNVSTRSLIRFGLKWPTWCRTGLSTVHLPNRMRARPYSHSASLGNH